MFLPDGVHSLASVSVPGSVWSFLSVPQRAGLVQIVKAQRAKFSTDICDTYGMTTSTSKTEVMTVSKRPDKLDINTNETQLKQTNEFKYLGSMFTENGKLDREREIRCQKANAVSYQLAPLLKHPNISTSTKAILINGIFLPTLTYQCQT